MKTKRKFTFFDFLALIGLALSLMLIFVDIFN